MSANTLRESTRTTLIAITVAAMGVAILSGFTAGTTEVITQMIFGIVGFVISGLATLVVLLIPSVRSRPVAELRRIIWISASCSGFTFLLVSRFIFAHHCIR